MAASSDDRGNERAGGGDSEQEERTDGWMATYADMVTLLLTFFVLMFALSNVDNQKAEMFLFAMSRGGITAEQFLEIQEKYDLDELDGSEWDDMFPAPPHDEENVGEEESAAQKSLKAIADAIQTHIDDNELGNDLSLIFNGDSLLLTFANDVWFMSGSADVSEEMNEKAVVIGETLSSNFHTAEPFDIMVVGHTDNVPMNTAQFPSNWHLSSARATNFLWLLLQSSGLDPWHFVARGCGEHRPIASNDTPEGRQANRRVEVMITLATEDPIWDPLATQTHQTQAVPPPDDPPGD
ncbi:MAG: OmpA family protein [Oscillospiraceae bacterium]|jgi:chemotaxis protein MotB|nr:OmpA family protein [Oscillospiraceae bacterium]